MFKNKFLQSCSFSSYFQKLNFKSTQDTFYYRDLVKTFVKRKVQPQFDLKKMTFGQQPTEHMVSIKSKQGIWGIPQIKPFQNLLIHPFNSSLHYAVQCYEGLKAYKNQDETIRLFRPQCNMMRFKQSSKRIALPDFHGKQLLKILQEYVRVEQNWIPPYPGFSLYIRPFHISLEDSLGVKSPSSSQLIIVSSPVGPYYPTGFNPISLSCDLQNTRSAPGGTGGHKVGGNYGPTITVANSANKKGHQQVLYLWDKKVGQAGTSNIFFVFKDNKTGEKEVVTPQLQDLVLPGVTRDTIIQLLRSKKYKVTERSILIDQLIQRHKSGEFVQCFCSGTAVIVSPVKNIQYLNNDYPVQINQTYKSGQLTYQIFKEILDIQEGRIKDNFGWSKIIKKP